MRLPFLKSFGKTEKIAINSAVMTLTNAETDTTLQPPVQLTLMVVDSLGRVAFLVDQDEGTNYFGDLTILHHALTSSGSPGICNRLLTGK